HTNGSSPASAQEPDLGTDGGPVSARLRLRAGVRGTGGSGRFIGVRPSRDFGGEAPPGGVVQ
ncbi:MAG: hypothetical protein OXE92_04575, partial [Bacteroidetes bacterium]|nr:hypothetical protein [Bacteroidota bacterium]